ncbi:MAG: Hpt domain-containing protein, partial [Tolypothrix sp. Co-bin9]|nr:Hpt domain-containing protein [Tolypothrix sp. Co-bin9]
MIEDEELRDLYKISGEECLQKLEAGLLHLQNHPLDEATLERLRREAHSLKGDSKIVGVENVVILSHQVEQILLSIKAREIIFTPDVSDRLYQGLSTIGLLVHEAVTGEASGVDTEQVLDQLMGVFLESKEHGTSTEVVSINVPSVTTNLGNRHTIMPLSPLEVSPEVEENPQISVEQGNQFTTTTPISQINRNAPQTRLIFIEDEELRDIYQVASEEHLDKLVDGLQYLQKHPEDKATLERLRREIHSLKGDSRSVGVENVATLSHQVEEIFLSIKRQDTILTPDLSDRLYQALDAIGLLVYEAVTGEPSGVDIAQVLNSLMQAVLESQQ